MSAAAVLLSAAMEVGGYAYLEYEAEPGLMHQRLLVGHVVGTADGTVVGVVDGSDVGVDEGTPVGTCTGILRRASRSRIHTPATNARRHTAGI